MKKLSVIMPIYRIGLSSLEKNINLLINQIINFSNLLEFVIIANGTNEEILFFLNKIIKKYDFIYLKILKKNMGINYARDIGIIESNGEYIWSIDCDDQVCSKSIEEILKILNIKKDVDYISFDSYWVLKENYFKYLISHNQIKDNFEFAIFNLNSLETQIKVFSAPWLYIVKKEIILKNKIKYDDSYIKNFDQFFIYKFLLFAENALIIKKPFYIYNQNTEFSIMDNGKDFFGENSYINVFNNFIQVYNENKFFSKKLFLFFLSTLFDILITPKNFNFKNKDTKKNIKIILIYFNKLKKENYLLIKKYKIKRKLLINFISNFTNLKIILFIKKVKILFKKISKIIL